MPDDDLNNLIDQIHRDYRQVVNVRNAGPGRSDLLTAARTPEVSVRQLTDRLAAKMGGGR